MWLQAKTLALSVGALPVLASCIILSKAAVVDLGQLDQAAIRIRPSLNDSSHIARAPKLGNLESAKHLFGKASPITRSKATVNIPATRLKLTLEGIFTHSDPSKASAIISSKKNSARYRVGDLLPGNATLLSVDRLSVVLGRNGRKERLWFSHVTEKRKQQITNQEHETIPMLSQNQSFR